MQQDTEDPADTKTLTVRMPISLRERIEAQAAREDRTASQFVRFHLDRLIAAETETTNTSES